MDRLWCGWMLDIGMVARGSKLTLTLGFRLKCGVGRTSNSSEISILTLTFKLPLQRQDHVMHGQAQPKRPSIRRAGLDKGPGSLKLPLFSAVRTRYGTPPSLSRVECRVNQGCIQMNPRGIPPSKKRLDGCATRKQIGGTGGQVMQRGPRSNELGSSPRVPCLPGTTTAPTQPVIRARQDEPEGGHYANRPVTSRSSGA